MVWKKIGEEMKKVAKKVTAFQAKDDVITDQLVTFLSGRGWPVKRRWDTSDWHWITFELPLEGLDSLKVRIKRQRYGVGIPGVARIPMGVIGPAMSELKFTVVFKERGFLFKKKSKSYRFTMNLDEFVDDDLKVIDKERLRATFEKYLKTMGF
jgi:hypothetical protein